jgi:hypothetical protein
MSTVKLEGEHAPKRKPQSTKRENETNEPYLDPHPPQTNMIFIPARSPKRKPQSTKTEDETKEPYLGVTLLGKGISAAPRSDPHPPQSNMIVIPAHPRRKSKSTNSTLVIPTQKNDGKVIVVAVLDMKSTRSEILGNWRNYTPAKIVGIHREHYQNQRSLAVMLSRMKKCLNDLEDPPDDKYLSEIALSKKEYNAIRQQNNDVRKRGAMSVHVVSNADDLVLQAMTYLTSRDPNLLYCGLLLVTGLRPIEIVKMAAFATKLNNKQGEKDAWFACQTRFAKRGTMKTKYNQCRDRCFLVPYWVVERALEKVRHRWPVKHLSNVEINRKYASHWGKILVKAYPQWPGITARLCRRFFAVYAYHYFGTGFFMDGSSQSSLIGFSSWMLGHADLEGQAIAYQSLVVKPAPKLKLFQLGKELNSQATPKLKQIKQ